MNRNTKKQHQVSDQGINLTSVKARFTRYERNCPPVIIRTFVLTRPPLISDGEASAIYTGAVTDATPTPRPTKSLPKIRTQGFGAAAMTMDPSAKTTSAERVAFLRPKVSLIQPPTAAPITAPTKAMLTIVSWKFVQSKLSKDYDYKRLKKHMHLINAMIEEFRNTKYPF